MNLNLSLPLVVVGAGVHYYLNSTQSDEAQPQAQESDLKSSVSNIPIDDPKLDMFLLLLKVSKNAILHMKFVMASRIESTGLSDWRRSSKVVESIVLIAGTAVMAYSNFTPFKEGQTLLSKVTAIGGSLLAESKNILTMHQLMTGISNLAMNRKSPLRELSIAGIMILAGHFASRAS